MCCSLKLHFENIIALQPHVAAIMEISICAVNRLGKIAGFFICPENLFMTLSAHDGECPLQEAIEAWIIIGSPGLSNSPIKTLI